KRLESVLTIVGGKIVYATAEFSRLGPPELPVSPSWSPVNRYGGYAKGSKREPEPSHSSSCSHVEPAHGGHSHIRVRDDFGLWGLGCDCFAFWDPEGRPITIPPLSLPFFAPFLVDIIHPPLP